MASSERQSLGVHLAAVFDVERDRIEADLDRFLADCEGRNLIRQVAEKTPHFFMAATMECWLRRLEQGVPVMDFELKVEPAI